MDESDQGRTQNLGPDGESRGVETTGVTRKEVGNFGRWGTPERQKRVQRTSLPDHEKRGVDNDNRESRLEQ